MATENFKYVVFLVLIGIVASVLYAIFIFQNFILANITWIVILLVFLFVIYRWNPLLQLVDFQRAVVYRFGKVNRVGGPGWAWVWPIIESYALVDLRVKTIDVPKQHVVTKDGV
ncbi:MAG: SPFH domain-containing protein, partial [archaeon]